MNASTEIDETYPTWEPVEVYIDLMVRKTLKTDYDFNRLFVNISAVHGKISTMEKSTEDQVVNRIALHIAVATRYLFHSNTPLCVFVPKSIEHAVGLACEILEIQKKRNPFPLQMQAAIFTVLSEKAIKIDVKSRTHALCQIALSIETIMLLMLCDISKTRLN